MAGLKGLLAMDKHSVFIFGSCVSYEKNQELAYYMCKG
jgi:hypothetical protein